MAELKRLFSKANIGSMELRNRLCMGEIIVEGGGDGNVRDTTVEFYVERAKGGAALIMLGASYPSESGGYKNMARLSDDRYIPKLTRMTRQIHEASPGVKVGIQIAHVGRQTHVGAGAAIPGTISIAPSPIPCRGCGVPHELTTQEVEDVVREFVEAARRVKEAEFDCVGLHGAHGYLISSFISPYTNKRTDKYGGSVENRARFACEIIEGIKKLCGEDFPVLIKINAEDYVDPNEFPLANSR